MVHVQGLSEKAQSSCNEDFAAAPVKELARCVEQNKNPRNVVPVGVIHHRGIDGSSEGLPKPQPCRPPFDTSSLADRASAAESLAGRQQDS